MEEFARLIKTLEHLLGEQGCPWDRVQTLMSLRESVLEETCELIEAVDLNDNAHILEELGDLLFNVIFFCKVAEKEKRFSTADVINHLVEKLVRRHPHVFADAKINDMTEFWHQWNAIKRQEKGKEDRTSALDGIPKELPPLARAQKMVKKMEKTNYPLTTKEESNDIFTDEGTLGRHLLSLVDKARKAGIDAEQALRKELAEQEQAFRQWEKR